MALATCLFCVNVGCVLPRDGMLDQPLPDSDDAAAAGGFDAAPGDGGAASSGEGGAANPGTGDEPGPVDYGFRLPITLTTAAVATPSAYSVRVVFDHAALVAAGKSLPSGDDVRVFRKSSSGMSQLHRVLGFHTDWNRATTAIWFRTTDAMGTNQNQTGYFVYYGHAAAGSPPADPGAVFEVFDDFDDETLDPMWTLSMVGDALASVTESEGKLRLKGQSADIWGAADDFVFLQVPIDGGFVADSCILAAGGQIADWSKLGGVMVRQSLDPGSRNRLVAPLAGVAVAPGQTTSVRSMFKGTTVEVVSANATSFPEHVRLIRTADRTQVFHSDQGSVYTELGSLTTFELTDPIHVGVPFANLGAGNGWVDVDWFRVRKFTEDPGVVLGAEQPGPFTIP